MTRNTGYLYFASLLFIVARHSFVFFSSILITNRHCFLPLSTNFTRIEFYPFPFPSPRALPSRSPISYPRPARPPSFLSISRPGVIDTSDSSVRRDGRRSPTEPATKTNEGSVCIVYSRGSSMEARVFRAAILEWNFYNGHFSPFPPYDLFLLFVREREISNFPPLLLPSNSILQESISVLL